MQVNSFVNTIFDSNDLFVEINNISKLIEEFLENSFKQTSNVNSQKADLQQAVFYSILNGGKRLRPFIVYLAGFISGAKLTDLIYPANAIEFVHSFTLVHDDLPAMDNDDLRRGKATTHKMFNESTAILAGDSMLSYAFELLLNSNINNENKLLQIKELAVASGFNGVCFGQALDKQEKTKTLEDLALVHKYKTSCLIKSSFLLGLFASDNFLDHKLIELFSNLADNMGIMYQIKDDLLDIEGDQKLIGKPVNSDVINNKSTYVSLLGIDGAKFELLQYKNNCLLLLNELKQYINQINSSDSKNMNCFILLEKLIYYFSNRDK